MMQEGQSNIFRMRSNKDTGKQQTLTFANDMQSQPAIIRDCPRKHTIKGLSKARKMSLIKIQNCVIYTYFI